MKKQITITYNFWNELAEGKEIPLDAQMALEEAGKQRALKMMEQGYTSGELNESFNDIDYRGHWEINTQTL